MYLTERQESRLEDTEERRSMGELSREAYLKHK